MNQTLASPNDYSMSFSDWLPSAGWYLHTLEAIFIYSSQFVLIDLQFLQCGREVTWHYVEKILVQVKTPQHLQALKQKESVVMEIFCYCETQRMSLWRFVVIMGVKESVVMEIFSHYFLIIKEELQSVGDLQWTRFVK